MTNPHQKAFYKQMSENEIAAAVKKEGFHPIRIVDPPGNVYHPHRHPETKLLAFLKGTMRIKAGSDTYQCEPGDKVVIPGNIEHAAWVGDNGCTFFWSEKVIH